MRVGDECFSSQIFSQLAPFLKPRTTSDSNILPFSLFSFPRKRNTVESIVSRVKRDTVADVSARIVELSGKPMGEPVRGPTTNVSRGMALSRGIGERTERDGRVFTDRSRTPSSAANCRGSRKFLSPRDAARSLLSSVTHNYPRADGYTIRRGEESNLARKGGRSAAYRSQGDSASDPRTIRRVPRNRQRIRHLGRSSSAKFRSYASRR